MSLDNVLVETNNSEKREDQESSKGTSSQGRDEPIIEFYLKYQEIDRFTGELKNMNPVYNPSESQIPYVEKYCREHGQPELFLRDLEKHNDLLDLAQISMEVPEHAGIAENSCNAYIRHGFFPKYMINIPKEFSKKEDFFVHWANRAGDCLSYYIGLAMMEEFEKLIPEVEEKIRDQGLTGYVKVDLMSDFHYRPNGKSELRTVAQYPGNSTDLIYSVAKPKQRETKFSEYNADDQASFNRYKFFNDSIIHLEEL